MNKEEILNIEVCYATPEKQKIISLSVPIGTSIEDSIKLSLIEQYFSDFSYESFGIWGKKVPTEYQLKNGDRIELYRKLIFDPKVRRLEKAKKA